MPQHIGIVACSSEGAALCYRTLCIEGSERLGAHAHPEISLHGHSLADYVERLERHDRSGIAALMLDSADKLARAGADFLICPDNTLHDALPLVEPRSPRPWLHIAQVIAARATERGFHRLGLTGTRWLVGSEVYPGLLAAHGIECMRPTLAEREAVHEIIMQELVRGVQSAGALDTLQRVVRRMQAAGCDAVVLACTELPLILNDTNSPLPTLDSTRELARAALQRACAAP